MVRFGAALFVAGVSLSCASKPTTYHSNVEILRLEVIRRDEAGKPLTVDIEYSFFECPGEQRQTIRGPKDFATCVERYKAGDKVPVDLRHEMLETGEMGTKLVGLGGCPRTPDPNDEASWELVQVCSDLMVNSVKVGFHCDRKPSKELLTKCPWFRRR